MCALLRILICYENGLTSGVISNLPADVCQQHALVEAYGRGVTHIPINENKEP